MRNHNSLLLRTNSITTTVVTIIFKLNNLKITVNNQRSWHTYVKKHLQRIMSQVKLPSNVTRIKELLNLVYLMLKLVVKKIKYVKGIALLQIL